MKVSGKPELFSVVRSVVKIVAESMMALIVASIISHVHEPELIKSEYDFLESAGKLSRP